VGESKDMLEQIENDQVMPHSYNRETFRPVSILDGGLEMNDNDFNFDLNKNNLGTIQEDLGGTFCGRSQF